MRDFFLKALMNEAKANEDLVFITGDLGFGVFEEFEQKFPKQYLNLGIAEQSMTGIAAGLGLDGRPVITYSIGNFPTLRCLEQIRNDAAYHDANLTIVCIGGGFSYGQLGMSHHATEDIAIMRALPNVQVFVPNTNEEAEIISRECFASPSTSYLRLDKSSAKDADSDSAFEFGKLRMFKKGEEVAIICTGSILDEAILASNILYERYSIRMGVYGCHSIKPFDENTFIRISKNYKSILTLEEHNSIGGLGSLICETIVQNNLKIDNFKRLSIQDEFSSVVGDQNFLRNHYGISSNHVVESVLEIIK